MNKNGFWLMLLLQAILLSGKTFSFLEIGWAIVLLPVMIYAGGLILMYICLVLGQKMRKKRIKKEG